MTADERREAEQVLAASYEAMWESQAKSGDGHDAAVEIIAAARVRWQNEALEKAEKLFLSWCADHGMRVQWAWEFQEKIRALKK